MSTPVLCLTLLVIGFFVVILYAITGKPISGKNSHYCEGAELQFAHHDCPKCFHKLVSVAAENTRLREARGRACINCGYEPKEIEPKA